MGMTQEKGPEFSVVITAYNKGVFIRQTVESVLKQTLQDFEMIIIDDGSTDDTRAIVASFNDSRIRYIYQENSGLPARGRNKGMGLARGKYIALLDGDDFWHEDKLRRSKEAFETVPEADVVCHNMEILYNGKTIRKTSFGHYVDNMYKKMLFEGNCLTPSAVVIRRNIFFKDGFKFDEDENNTIEDYEYWLRLARNYVFHFIDDVLGYYHLTDHGFFLSHMKANTTNMIRLLDNHFAQFDKEDKYIQEMIRKRLSSIMCAAGRMHNHNRDFDESMRWYVRAAREYPINYKAYLGYLLGILKIRIIYG